MEALCRRLNLFTGLVFSLSLLTACGGGGSSGDDGGDDPAPVGWQQGVFQPSANFANQCTSVLPQNNWLRSWSHETYLWYDEIQDRNPANYSDPLAYFELLKTDAFTPSGSRKDNFHFSMPTDDWEQQSQSGVAVGYGFQWALLSATPPRRGVVAYSDRDGQWPAGIQRGLEVVSADGVDLAYGNDVDTLNAAFFPSDVGEKHLFVLRDPDTAEEHEVLLTAEAFTSDPVQDVKVLTQYDKRVGYLLFNDHIATAEKELVDAVNQLKVGEGIDELVLDLRYNGGGYLAIASQLAYMIAGAERTGAQWDGSEWTGSSKIFEKLQFNDQHPYRDPVTGEPLEPLPFIGISVGLSPSLAENQLLPTLDLQRVFVLAGPNTCSASESIINGLRGVDVEVVLIGAGTCGKPYGFHPEDNCATTYFTIQFKGVNDKGFGEYSDGFVPNVDYDDGEAIVKGCEVADDFSRPLGDASEERLATALHYIANGSCAGISAFSFAGEPQIGAQLSSGEGKVSKSLWRQNRIVLLGR